MLMHELAEGRVTRACILAASLVLASSCASKQPAPTPAPQRAAGTAAATPPAATPSGGNQRQQGPRPFREVVPASARADDGMFTVYRTTDDKILFQIPDSLLGREMLMVSRWARVPSNFGGFNPAGFSAQEQVFTWERHGNRIQLRKQSYDQVAADSTPISQSVVANNWAPIIASFAVAAIGPDSASVVIDVTDFYKGDTPAISGLDPNRRRTYGVRRLDPDRSYINYARSYPMNVEVRHTQTFEAATPPTDVHTGVLTLEMNQSLVLLPKEPMRPRYWDERVGYFGIRRINFGVADQKAPEERFIRRWRLEPKDPQAYMRGELVEPIKPIVYYLDPATPNEYRQCVRDGVNDWQPAFETAGFKNAIYAKDPPSPQEDPDWDPEDARYTVVRWAASLTRNAQGPSTVDPRTGEIIESDIVWYHNHLRSYRNRIMIETGAANPLARRLPIDDGLMCEAMRQVIAHEVGHAIGLPHNMIASSAYPTDSLRSPTFVRKWGLAPTLMDYTRQNYVAQPGDGMQPTDFLRRLGPYDHYVINWGYRALPQAPTAEAERPILNQWVKEKAHDPVYRFLQGAPMAADPRAQTENVGDDPVKASGYGVANLKRVVSNLVEWTSKPGEDYTDLIEVYTELEGIWGLYMGHVAQIIGGVEADLKTGDQPGGVYRPVTKAEQKAAVQFLSAQVFEAPVWLLEPAIVSRVGHNVAGSNQIMQRQAQVLGNVMSPARIGRLTDAEVLSSGNTYTVREFLGDVKRGVWQDPASTSRNAYRRALQREHIDRLAGMLRDAPAPTSGGPGGGGGGGGGGQGPARNRFDLGNSDVRAIVRAQLRELRSESNAAAGRTGDTVARAHLNDIVQRIDTALDPKN